MGNESRTTETSHQQLIELSADEALFRGQIQGLVASFHENERPLSGLAGLLDFRFQGAVSRRLRDGAISGKPGECAYFPLVKAGAVYHLILIGAGSSDAPGSRTHLPPESAEALRKNLLCLKLPRLGVSRGDFGNADAAYFRKQFKEVPLWIAP